MEALDWKKFGFKMAFNILDVIEEDLVPNTANKWDDTAVQLVKSTLFTLQAVFVVETPALK